ALWAEFKAATDAVFRERDAAISAREAALKTNQGAREALIARLGELGPDTPAAEIKRTLAAADQEWSRAGEAPRSEAGRLDARFRAARDAALRLSAGSAQRAWQATCDALCAKLVLCEEAEAMPVKPAPEMRERWSALPGLPPAWDQLLQARFEAALENQPNPGQASASIDTTLLQLECALGLDS